MARYRGPRLKIIRRLGTPIPGLMRTEADLKRPYPPGQHGPSRKSKLSGFALRLREKQKLRFHYGVSEKQLRRYVENVFKTKGNPGLNLLVKLESRLDNVIFRSCFAPTINSARQMVRHGHITINDKCVDIPSYSVSIGEIIGIRENSKMKEAIYINQKDPDNLSVPEYLAPIEESKKVRVLTLPTRKEIPVIVNEQLIIEYYSGK